MKQIYTGFGITITKQDKEYFLQYDSGEIVGVLKKIEISNKKQKTYRSKRMEEQFMHI